MTQTVDYERNMVLATQTYDVVGTRPIRHDGTDKVTGRAQYGADYADEAGLLHGHIVRSPHAHANIKNIDTSKAVALEGVLAVVTHADFSSDAEGMVDMGEGAPTSLKWVRDNVLASDKALYRGHAIAGVAAVNPHIAEEAAGLIEVDYEVLPPVVTVEDAMAEGATILHADLKTMELGEETDNVSNVADHFQHKKGDTAAGFAEADVIVEREYRAKTVHPGLHRAAQRDRAVERRWQSACMVQHSGRVRRPRRDGAASGNARIQHQGYSHGDRRRIRRQDSGISGACRCAPVQEVRPCGQASYEQGGRF